MTKDNQPLLEVDGLRKTFYVRGGLLSSRKTVPAVQGVSFNVFPSDCYGIIGESG